MLSFVQFFMTFYSLEELKYWGLEKIYKKIITIAIPYGFAYFYIISCNDSLVADEKE